MEYEKRALAIVEAQAVKQPSDLNVLDLSSAVYEMMGSIQAGSGSSASLGDIDGAIDNHRKALAGAERLAQMRPDSEPDRLSALAISMELADDYLRKGDRAEAIRLYGAAVKWIESVGVDHLHPEARHLAATVYERMGTVHMMDGDAAAAVLSYGSAVAIEKRSVVADPKDALARMDLYTDQALLGMSLTHAGRHADGLAMLNVAIAGLERERASDPGSFAVRVLSLDYVLRGQLLLDDGSFAGSLVDFRRAAACISAAGDSDPQAKVALAAIDSKVADVLAKQGDYDGARRRYTAALATLEPLAAAPQPAMQVVFATADSYTGLGELRLHAGAGPTEDTAAKVARLKEARALFAQASGLWRKLPNPGRFNMDGFSTEGPARPASLGERCDAELAKLGAGLSASNHPTP